MADGWRGPRSRRIERSAAALALLLVALVAAACGGEDEGARTPVTVTTARSRPATTVPAATTTSAAPTTTVFAFGFDQQLISKVWADYEAAIGLIKSSLMEPSSDTALETRLTGAMLDHWKQRLAEMAATGQYMYYPPDTSSHEELFGVSLVDDATIELTVCIWDDAIIANQETGEIIDGDRELSRAKERLELNGGRWKLAARDGRKAEEAECTGL